VLAVPVWSLMWSNLPTIYGRVFEESQWENIDLICRLALAILTSLNSPQEWLFSFICFRWVCFFSSFNLIVNIVPNVLYYVTVRKSVKRLQWRCYPVDV
jgi:hypothetical protein